MSDPDPQSELSDLFEVDEQDGADPALIAARRRLVRRALITVTQQPPKTEAELMKNPLGLKIEDISWTPDAS